MPGEATVVVEFDHIEKGAALKALTNERNQLIKGGRPTDTMNDLIVKIAHAPQKKRRGRDEGR
jgi:hypothetical protein